MNPSVTQSPSPRSVPWPQVGWSLPGVLWLGCFLILPVLLLLVMSGMTRDELGDPRLPWTLENFKRLAGWGTFGFDPLYPRLIGETLLIAFLSTLVTLVLALPLAFALASLPVRWRTTALVLVTVPMWTNLVVRTYAWQMLLGPHSWVSQCLHVMGILDSGEGLYPGMGAVAIGMVCDYLPFLVLPIYASVEKLDRMLLDAGRDLGASGWTLFRHSVWPQISPGVMAGCLLTFIPATGQFLIPDLLGGGKTMLLGNALQQQFGSSNDWPFGAAMTVFFLLLVMILSGLNRLLRPVVIHGIHLSKENRA